MVEFFSFAYINKVYNINETPKDNLFIMKDRNLHSSHLIDDSDLLFSMTGFHTSKIFNELKMTTLR